MTDAGSESATRCANCGTELPPHALSCGACGALVYSAKLKDLAATAERQAAAGELNEARATWDRAMRWLPPASQQYTAIKLHIDELDKRINETPGAPKAAPAGADTRPWWRRGVAGVIAIVVVAFSKLKFLLLGLTKMGTVLSMFGFVAAYWGIYGWRLALGFTISIYIHEMGHVVALKRQGIDAGAPLFIPGIGALVMFRTHILDPQVDARIGLAGPVWGLGAALAAYAIYRYTGAPIWGAIAQLSAIINLLNLVPFWQLDGARGFHALVTWQRWAVIGALGGAYLLTGFRPLSLIGIVGIYEAFQKPKATTPDYRALATFVVLIFALSWLSVIPLTTR